VKVTGTVVAEDGEEVIGASIVVKGTPTGTVTNFDGTFQLDVPQSATTLVVSYIGMRSQEVAIKSVMHIVLQADSQDLDEVIVVGYGTQRKRDVTSAISRVGGEELANIASASFDSQLAGRAAGVLVTTPSGVLGASPQFNIRGTSTMSSNSQPLIILDGVPLSSGDMGVLSGSNYNAMADINPNDIESIEILKDGAATAVYGSRAANGVVLITTKKGSKGAAKVTYDGYIGFGTPTKTYDLLNARDFVTIANEKMANAGKADVAVYNANDPDINWNDYVYRTGLQHTHTVAASGGSEKNSYYFSLGYTNQEGIVRNNQLERFNIKGDVTQQATKWLKVGLNVQASRGSTRGFLNGTNNLSAVGYGIVRMFPNVSVFDDSHPTGYNIDREDAKALGRGSNLAINEDKTPNIVWVLDKNKMRTSNARIIGGGWGEITFMDGLTLRTQAGMDYSSLKDFRFRDPASGDAIDVGDIYDYRVTRVNWNWQNVLNFYRTFDGVHNLSATAVQEYTYNEYERTGAYVSDISDTYFNNHIISNTYVNQLVYGGTTQNGLASYLFRANYNYDSKYYIGASVRADGLSRLPKDSRWGTFYGASAAWRLSREGFWKDTSVSSWLDDLRIRASYATIGNSEIGYDKIKGNISNDFPYMNSYTPVGYGSSVGIAWTNFGNDKLKWETTETFDIGLDGTLFNNRLTFEMAYWQKNTKDLVMQVSTAPSLGVPGNSYFTNNGKLSNSGFELSLGADVISNRKFKWHADFNFSTLKNKVKQLNNSEDVYPDNYVIVREGESYRTLYGYQFVTVNKANGNAVYEKANGDLVQAVGSTGTYAKFDEDNPNDVSQTTSLNTTDRVLLGKTLPAWFGGFNNTFTYGDFDLNVFFRFSGGNKVMNVTRQTSLLNMKFANNGTEILKRWQSPENPGNGIIPKIGNSTTLHNTQFNDGYTDSRFVENGSYLKLSTLTLGYTLPKEITSKLNVTRMRFYLQGTNIFTISGYKGMDPETLSSANEYGSGVDFNGMPQQSTFTFGANITF